LYLRFCVGDVIKKVRFMSFLAYFIWPWALTPIDDFLFLFLKSKEEKFFIFKAFDWPSNVCDSEVMA